MKKGWILGLALALSGGLGAAQGQLEGLQEGPADAKIGEIAQIKVDKGFLFVPDASAEEFMRRTGNIPSNNELGILIDPDEKSGWFAIFEFEEVGYIKDPEKEKLDPAALLESIREGNNAANEERKKMGADVIDIVGWHTEPFFNPATKRLEWAILGKSKDGEVVNYKTRVLGRKGVMSVVLVCGPQELNGALKSFGRALESFDYTSGNKYSEWKTGDKVAAAGLAALILGGIGAKTGLLQKFFKFIWIGVLALFAFAKKIWDAIRGRSSEPTPTKKESAFDGDLPKGPSASAAQPTMDDDKK